METDRERRDYRDLRDSPELGYFGYTVLLSSCPYTASVVHGASSVERSCLPKLA